MGRELPGVAGMAQLADDRQHRLDLLLPPVIAHRQGDELGGSGGIDVRSGLQLEDHVADQMAALGFPSALLGGFVALLQIAVGEGTGAFEIAVEGGQELAEPPLLGRSPEVRQAGAALGRAQQYPPQVPQQPGHGVPEIEGLALAFEVWAQAQLGAEVDRLQPGAEEAQQQDPERLGQAGHQNPQPEAQQRQRQHGDQGGEEGREAPAEGGLAVGRLAGRPFLQALIEAGFVVEADPRLDVVDVGGDHVMNRLLPLRGLPPAWMKAMAEFEILAAPRQEAADVLDAGKAEIVVEPSVEKGHIGTAIADQRTAEVGAGLRRRLLIFGRSLGAEVVIGEDQRFEAAGEGEGRGDAIPQPQALGMAIELAGFLGSPAGR
jgi:hypothetical protein